jgi:CRISPR-associated protein Csb2
VVKPKTPLPNSMFALEVEFLTGRVYATDFRERDVLEWPPHPSRLFSALVAAFYESGLDSGLRTALVWLEEQRSPHIWAGNLDLVGRLESAVGGRFGQPKTPGAFVPINDDYSGKFRNSSGRRKERWFPSGTPENERVHFIWKDATPDAATVDALQQIAAQVSYLGHSSSLARVAVIKSPRDAVLKPSDDGDTLLRIPSKGRLQYLDREFARSQGARQFRPDAGAVQPYARVGKSKASTPTPASSFGEMIVFQRLSGSPERIESLLTVTSVLRDALMARSPQQPAPGCISGHGDTSHIACVALPFVNHRYADGSLKGVAIILPKDLTEADQLLIFGALNGIEELNSEQGMHWQIRRCLGDAETTTLSEGTWTQKARVWASVSPMLLDRFPKPINQNGKEPIANVPEYKVGNSPEEIVADACERIGLPRQKAVRLHKNSLVLGVPPSTRFHLRRRKDEAPRLASHVILEFPEPVQGPVLLGAGRYFGLGLFLPLPALEGIPL